MGREISEEDTEVSREERRAGSVDEFSIRLCGDGRCRKKRNRQMKVFTISQLGQGSTVPVDYSLNCCQIQIWLFRDILFLHDSNKHYNFCLPISKLQLPREIYVAYCEAETQFTP